jgi:SET domain-containing protein
LRQSVLRIGNAGSKGLGVFASGNIPEGTVVARYRGRAKWIWDIPRGLWDRCLQVGYDRYVVPTKGSFGWFLNHSCDPNCAVGGEREIVALRRIAKGEELTFDYSTNVGWDGFSMECHCGAENCRRTIVSYWGLSVSLRKKYGRKVSPYLLRSRQ